jgi:hypothetical protein
VIVRRVLAAALSLLVGAGFAFGAGGSGARTVGQPPEPRAGPGGRDYSHADVRVSSGGEGNDSWYVFEPVQPRPRSAPVVVVMHGYYEYSGYSQMAALIRHTVRKGNLVIYPRWQTGVADPCPGPFNIEPCMGSAARGIVGALDYLRASHRRVQPELGKASYFGFSFGAIITANLADRFRVLRLPKPRVIFLDDPSDGGLAGPGEPALDPSLAGIPADALFECHSGADGALELEPGGMDHASCNALFPKLTQIPDRHKDLVLTHTDTHGSPPLSSAHGVCTAQAATTDAYDWNFCWKVFDALRDCAYQHRNCSDALGNSFKHRSLGRWSDGVPVIPLKIQHRVPIRP